MIKISSIVLSCVLLTSCGAAGWMAGSALKPRQGAQFTNVSTHLDGNTRVNGDVGAVVDRDLTEIHSAQNVVITRVPWSIIWLLMLGWPLALIGWMIDPPAEIYQSWKLKKKL